MARHTARVGMLLIDVSVDDDLSNTLPISLGRQLIALVFVSPAAYTGTISVLGSMGSETPQALAVDGSAITLVAAQTQRVNISGIRQVAISSSGTEAADRSVEVYAEFDS